MKMYDESNNMPTCFIVAGTHEEFLHYLQTLPKDTPLMNFIFVSSYLKIQGMHGYELRYIGSWWRREDIFKIKEVHQMNSMESSWN